MWRTLALAATLLAIAVEVNAQPTAPANTPPPSTNEPTVNPPAVPGVNGPTVRPPGVVGPGTPTVNVPNPSVNTPTVGGPGTPSVNVPPPAVTGPTTTAGGPPLSPPAGPSNCADFRQKIIAMEAPGAIRPPGWFQLDLYLRQLYQTDCIDHPTRQPPKEYWYRYDGTSTGVSTDQPRPTDGAYATTQEIGDYCLALAGPLISEPRGTGKVRAGLSPSICAMAGNLRQACEQPVDDRERRQCSVILGDAKARANLPPPGEALPPMQIGLDGGPYTLSANCSALLSRLSGDPNADQAPAEEKQRWLDILGNECPESWRRCSGAPEPRPRRIPPGSGSASPA